MFAPQDEQQAVPPVLAGVAPFAGLHGGDLPRGEQIVAAEEGRALADQHEVGVFVGHRQL